MNSSAKKSSRSISYPPRRPGAGDHPARISASMVRACPCIMSPACDWFFSVCWRSSGGVDTTPLLKIRRRRAEGVRRRLVEHVVQGPEEHFFGLGAGDQHDVLSARRKRPMSPHSCAPGGSVRSGRPTVSGSGGALDDRRDAGVLVVEDGRDLPGSCPDWSVTFPPGARLGVHVDGLGVQQGRTDDREDGVGDGGGLEAGCECRACPALTRPRRGPPRRRRRPSVRAHLGPGRPGRTTDAAPRCPQAPSAGPSAQASSPDLRRRSRHEGAGSTGGVGGDGARRPRASGDHPGHEGADQPVGAEHVDVELQRRAGRWSRRAW